MSSQTAVFLRFPSGFSEVAHVAEAPQVGDQLKRGDDEWEVAAVETDEKGYVVVTLGPLGDGTVKPAQRDADQDGHSEGGAEFLPQAEVLPVSEGLRQLSRQLRRDGEALRRDSDALRRDGNELRRAKPS